MLTLYVLGLLFIFSFPLYFIYFLLTAKLLLCVFICALLHAEKLLFTLKLLELLYCMLILGILRDNSFRKKFHCHFPLLLHSSRVLAIKLNFCEKKGEKTFLYPNFFFIKFRNWREKWCSIKCCMCNFLIFNFEKLIDKIFVKSFCYFKLGIV